MDVCEQHLTELFQEYYMSLVYVCLRSFNYNSAFVPYIDDCIQNTFMAAIKKYDIFSKAANQEAWLKNACQKECFNLIRKTQRRRERLKEVTSCADEENFAIVQDAILFWLEQQDAQEKLNAIRASLTPRELQVYEAYFEQRKKVPEIVQETGESEQALRGVVKRIRSKARKIMEIAVFFFIATCFYFSRS